MKQIYLKFSMLLLCLVVGLSSAWGEEVTFTMGTGNDMTSNEGVTKNGITITATDGTSVVNNWGGTTYVRLQAGGTFVIIPNNLSISQIVLNCTSGYEKTWSDNTNNNLEVNATDHTVTWKGNTDSKIILKNTASAQARIKSIDITYEKNTSDNRTSINITSFATIGSVTSIVKGSTITTSVTNDQPNWTAVYTYSSSNESVATVSADGIITANGKGTATITVSLNLANDDAYYKAGTIASKTIDITVTNPTHKVYFSSNGILLNGDGTDVEEGGDIEFPATPPADIDDYKFVGWYGNTYSHATDAPEYITSATMKEQDMTFYAVFAAIVEGGENVWKQTPLNELVSEDVFVFTGDQYAMTNDNGTSNAPNAVLIAVSGDIITSEVVDNMKWNIGGNAADGYIFYPNGSTSKWLYCNTTATSSSNNNLRVGTGDRKRWVLDEKGYLITKDSGVTRYLSNYNGSDFRSYVNTSNGAFVPKFYKYTGSVSFSDFCTSIVTKALQSIAVSGTPTKTAYVAGETLDPTGLTVTGTYDDGSNSAITSGITWAFDPATLSVGQTNCNVTATVGEISSEAYTITGLTVTEPVTLSSISVSGTPSEFWKGDTFNHNGMTVTATYSDESTADVTNAVSFSEPDMTAIGEQTVTVTYQGKEATYTINVQTIANTKETAYTVTEAKALIDAGKDLTTEVYVKGTVSDVDNYNSTYKSITYWLDEKTFEVYSGRGLGNTDFNSIDDIEVGAEVIIYGIIKKYKDTYEFDKYNYLVEYTYNAPVHETYTITLNSCGSTINGESVIEVEEGKSVNLPQASTTATGFVFKGWSTTEQKDETNTLPTLVNNSYSPTTDITLYPIFEKSETTGDTDVEIAWVIKDVSELENNSSYVMVVTNGTNSKIISAEKSSEGYLTGRDVTIENGIITSNVPNDYPWIFNCYGENDKTYGFRGNNTGYLYNLGVSYSSYQRWGLVSNGDKTYSMESRGNSPYNHSGTYIYLDNNTIRTTSTPSESKVQFYAQDYIEVGGTTTYTYTSYPTGEMLTITLNPACHDEYGKVYSTFSSSKAFVVPENLIVSEIAIIDGKFYVESYKTNDVVPANTGVMVSAEEGGNYLVEVADAELSEVAESVLGTENSLRPSGDNGIQSTEMSALSEGCYFYRLTMKGEQIGYYWGAPEGVAFTLAPNKAYMVIEKTAEIKSGAWINEVSTSISNPNIIADNNVIYNLNGQRISSVTKGLYIKDGKKYFVK